MIQAIAAMLTQTSRDLHDAKCAVVGSTTQAGTPTNAIYRCHARVQEARNYLREADALAPLGTHIMRAEDALKELITHLEAAQTACTAAREHFGVDNDE